MHISGASSLYVYEYNGNRYFYIGDKHFDHLTETCEETLNIICDSPDYKFEKSILADTDCWTIVSLLDEWFTFNNLNNIKTNFYVELPFTKLEERPAGQDVMGEITDRRRFGYDDEYEWLIKHTNGVPSGFLPEEANSWIAYVGAFFSQCLTVNKLSCKYYPNIYFHYVDVRRIDTNENTTEMDIYAGNSYREFISKKSSVLADLLQTRKHNDKAKRLNYLNELIQDVTNIFQLYYFLCDVDIFARAYFSNQDVRLVLGSIQIPDYIAPNIKDIFYNIINTIIGYSVERNGIKLSRTSAEFNRLSLIDPDLANKLQEYIIIEGTEIMNKVKVAISAINHNTVEYFTEWNKTPHYYTADEINTLFNEVSETCDTLFSTLTLLSVFAMDIYALSRIFIQISTTPNIYQEIVVFAGYFHIDIYSRFMDYIGATRIINHPMEGDGTRCVTNQEIENVLDLRAFRETYNNTQYVL